jgi:uncharacterized membrane protein YhhN
MYIKAYYTNEFLLPLYLKLVVILYYVSMMAVLLPNLKEGENGLLVPILVYGMVIASMAAVAMARMFSRRIHIHSKHLALTGNTEYLFSHNSTS